uniref:G protein-coupled receptor n=1 Tax=Globodera rostochiensis TaxID=31243 RepID=A0A914I264_GLORO
MSLTSVIVLNSSNSSSLVGYDENVESFYLTFLDIGTWLAIIVQLFFYRFVFRSTPKNMFNYKITVTNTSTWCLLMTIFFGVLLRPVPLFPIPAAKVTGPLKNFGEFWGAQYAWIFAVLCTANFISACMNCFVVLAIFLLEPRGFFGRLSRVQGICLAMFNHLLTSTAVVLFMTVVYAPVTDLKEKLLSRYPAELSPVLSPNDAIVFGYDPAHGPNLMAAFVLILFLVQGNIVNTLYALLVRKIWVQIKKSSARETARNRRNVVLMLTARMTFPTLFGFLPLMISCACLWFEVRNAFAFYCALSAIPIIHGLFNVLATIL